MSIHMCTHVSIQLMYGRLFLRARACASTCAHAAAKIGCEVTARKFVKDLEAQRTVNVFCSSACTVNVGETDAGWQVQTHTCIHMYMDMLVLAVQIEDSIQ